MGAGQFARAVLIPALKADASVALRGVAAATGVTARTIGEQAGFDYCTSDLDELLADDRVDAVVIATRHGLHARQVVGALRAGKHVGDWPRCV